MDEAGGKGGTWTETRDSMERDIYVPFAYAGDPAM